MPIPMPMSEQLIRQLTRFRERIVKAGLSIEEIDETKWRISASDGRELFYFPIEDRWRQGSTWGRGTLTLIDVLTDGIGS